MKLLFCLTNIILLFDRIRLTQEKCSDGEFQCSSSNQCIRGSYVCDGGHDCFDATDERNCHTELIESNFLIVADSERHNLYQVGLDDGIMVPILPTGKTSRPMAVAYDSFTGFVYWTDSERRMIGRYSLTAPATDISIVKQFGAAVKLEGLAIDTARQDLYYCDAGDAGKIGVMKTDGQENRELIQEVGMKPHSIVLDLDNRCRFDCVSVVTITSNRLMYWSDCGNRSSISRANMDTGADRVELVREERSIWPSALAIDFATRTMFWGDANAGQIQSANLIGTRRNLLYKNPADTYYGIAVTPRFLYITDWTASAVRKLDRQAKTLSNQPPAFFQRLSGIIYVAHVNGTGRIRPVTATKPNSTPFLTTTSSSATTASPTLEVDQPLTSAHVGWVYENTTIVSVVVVGIVLIAIIISLAVCVRKKRSKSSSVTAATDHPEEQLAVFNAGPTFRNSQREQTTTFDEDSTAPVYDSVTNIDVPNCLERQPSCSSDGYLRVFPANEQCCQQSPPQLGGSGGSRNLCGGDRYTLPPSHFPPLPFPSAL